MLKIFFARSKKLLILHLTLRLFCVIIEIILLNFFCFVFQFTHLIIFIFTIKTKITVIIFGTKSADVCSHYRIIFVKLLGGFPGINSAVTISICSVGKAKKHNIFFFRFLLIEQLIF